MSTRSQLPSPGPAWVTQRGVRLRDARAARWLGQRGVHVEPRRHGHIRADAMQHGSFCVMRVHQTMTAPMSISNEPATITTVFVTGGSIEQIDDIPPSDSLDVRNAALLRAEQSVRLRSVMPVSYIVLRSAELRPVVTGQAADKAGIIATDSHYRGVLVACVDALFAPAGTLTSEGNSAVERALLALATASLVLEPPPFGPRATDRSKLLASAHRLIRSRSRDPAFTVLSLARELRVSRATLDRAFADVGTTASKELRNQRAREAAAALQSGGRAAAHIAESSGFTSPRAMMRALRGMQS